MALPLTPNQISFEAIRNELGIPFQSNFSLRTAETNGYVPINLGSFYKPNQSAPAAISEWHGYEHAADAQTFAVGGNIDLACTNLIDQVFYIQNDWDICTADDYLGKIYTDAARTILAPSGIYSQFIGERKQRAWDNDEAFWTNTDCGNCPPPPPPPPPACSSGVSLSAGLSKNVVCCNPVPVTVYFAGGTTLADATNVYTDSDCTNPAKGPWYRDGATVREVISPGVLGGVTNCDSESCS